MRIRYKKWARPELEACKFYVDNPEELKGKWHEIFKNKQPINIELGCGKGAFIAELASSNLDTNYIAVDMVDAMLRLKQKKYRKSIPRKRNRARQYNTYKTWYWKNIIIYVRKRHSR